MKLIILRRGGTFALAAMVLVVLGCSDNSTEPKVTKPRYPEATTKDIVIENLLKSYKDHNITQFEKLLHADFYIWYNQARDVVSYGLPEFYTRDEDIAHTRNLFLAADHSSNVDSTKWVDRLALDISSGPWIQVDTLMGNPCEDCWQTTREYYIVVELKGGIMTLIGNGLVTLFVAPVTENATKLYYLRRADDIMRP
jgi:hypothetical protein